MADNRGLRRRGRLLFLRSVLLAVLGCISALALVHRADARGTDVWAAFSTPSKNVRCVVERNPQPPIGWAIACQVVSDRAQFSMKAQGRVTRMTYATAFPVTGQMLAYGKSRVIGPFRCTSSALGLKCRNSAERGWDLARGKHVVR